MTQLEVTFANVVPSALREIAKQLKIANGLQKLKMQHEFGIWLDEQQFSNDDKDKELDSFNKSIDKVFEA